MGNLWRPPQWASGASRAAVLLTFPGQSSTPQYGPSGIAATLPTAQTVYVFDAVFRAGHEQRLTKTKHPVQTGANISDHAYVEPARVVLELGMSDAMDSFTPGQWTGSPSKSVSAYQIMLAMQFARVPLTLTTRLRTYKNMVIVSLTPEDTVKTIAALRMRVEFEEIFAATTQTVPASARPQDTQQTNLGSVTAQPPTPTQQSQNEVPASVAPVNTPGAGAWSSSNVSNLPQLFPAH